MKIWIQADSAKFSIGIPTGLIFSKPSVWLYLKLARKFASNEQRYIPENVMVSVDTLLDRLPEEAVYAICEELRRIKRKHGSWELLNVESADGTIVKISL